MVELPLSVGGGDLGRTPLFVPETHLPALESLRNVSKVQEQKPVLALNTNIITNSYHIFESQVQVDHLRVGPSARGVGVEH